MRGRRTSQCPIILVHNACLTRLGGPSFPRSNHAALNPISVGTRAHVLCWHVSVFAVLDYISNVQQVLAIHCTFRRRWHMLPQDYARGPCPPTPLGQADSSSSDYITSQPQLRPAASSGSVGEPANNRHGSHGMGALVTTASTFLDFSDDDSFYTPKSHLSR